MNFYVEFLDFPKYKNVAECNFTHLNCLWEKYNKMSGEVPMGFSSSNYSKSTIKCNCFPDCEEVVSGV